MKAAVLNYTGTVGKTTIAAHMLAPRMNAPVIAIESINETASTAGVEVDKIRGDKFKEIFKKMMEVPDAIIDIGASNVEDFLTGMTKFEDSHLEIDYYIVPVTSGTKEQRETMNIIDVLSEFGIPADRIRVIFNRVDSDAAEEFAPIFNYAKKTGKCTVNPDAAIFENELFDMLAIKKMTVSALMADDTDYRAKSREEKDAKLRSQYQDMYIMKSLAKSVNRNLNEVFAATFQ
jgi:MinD-like ATPase involved in chromosome partitioning or flagellar assembly